MENRWDKLSMKDKATLIKLSVANGMYDLGSIRDTYNKLEDGGFTYIVQPGDTLSSIAQRITGKASNYKYLAAASNIDDPNKIYPNQKITIPDKFSTPLKKEEIPTNNEIHVIDNYSPNFNYIVENDKIYYSKKGNNYWVDISDNDVARKNLYNFLEDNYNFRGYNDDEKKIAKRIKEGNFDYHNYRDSVNKEIIKYNENIKKDIQRKSPNLLDNIDTSFFPNEIIQSLTKDVKHEQQNQQNGKNIKYSQEENKNTIEQQDLSIPEENIFEKVKEYSILGRNWLTRQISKHRNIDDKSKIEVPVFDLENSEYGIIPGSYTGDTIQIKGNNRRYILPESLDATSYIYGVRNRGDLNEIESEGAPITSFKPFKQYGKHEKGYNTYIGIGKDGKLKVGDISQFEEGDMLSGTYSNKVYSFVKDDKGNFVWQSDAKHGNRSKNVPQVEVEDEKTGEIIKKFPINILANTNDLKGTTYGNITGGRVLVKVGDEIRLLSGSISDIEKEFESMKDRQKEDYGIFYTLDNGSYNRGLRTYDKKFTKSDLQNYDQQNTGDSGNFLYIKGNYSKFPSDTVFTPNIRTKESESYKKGHSDTNEKSGILLHHTAFMDNDLESVTKHFLDKNTEASSHVVIGYDGKRRVFAEPEQVTYHAGSSYFNGRDNVNDFMIGIEFQGDTQKKPLTQSQIDSAVEYLAPIIRENGIPIENITTHKVVRDLYNQYRRKLNLGKAAPEKTDITFEEYNKILEALKNKVYYKK